MIWVLFWHQYFVKFFFISIPKLTGSLTERLLEIQTFYISLCHPGKALWKKGSSLWVYALFWSSQHILAYWLRVLSFCWNTAVPVCSHVVCACFPPALAELSSCDRRSAKHKIFSLWSCIEKVCQTLLFWWCRVAGWHWLNWLCGEEKQLLILFWIMAHDCDSDFGRHIMDS